MNELDYKFLLEDRLAKIRAINEQYDLEHNSYISFSGGKDSCCLSKLIDLALPNNKIPRIYVDTGIDYKLMRDFVYNLKEKDNRVIIISPQVNIKRTLDNEGYPFKSKDFAYRLNIFQRNGMLKGIEKYLTFNGRLGCPKKLRYLYENKDSANFKISDKCCLRMKEEPLINWGKKKWERNYYDRCM